MNNKIPTLKSLAKKLNLSVSTVSRALKDNPSIGEATKKQVKQLAKEMGYEPNQSALFFKEQKTYSLGVILPNLREEFFSEAINGIENEAKKYNYSVLIGQSHDDILQEKQIVTAMKNHRVDGLIISISKHTKNYDHFLALKKYGIPIVFFDRVPALENVHKVSSDIKESTKLAIDFLTKMGHREIGVINGPEEMKSTAERVQAYMDALQKKRIKIDLGLVENTDLTQEKTFAAMEALLSRKRKPTAILTINDYVALDAMQFARQKNQKLNKDISFVSHANLPITNYLEHAPLASVEQYPYEQAKKAAEILFELLNMKNDESAAGTEHFRNVLVQGRLVVHKK